MVYAGKTALLIKMVEMKVNWFSRKETVAELRGCEFVRKRRAFFDVNNKDFRLKEPGVNWHLVKEKREEVYQDSLCRIKEVFDEVCEKITGEHRKSSLPVLPTIKTPAISAHRNVYSSTKEIKTVPSQIQPQEESLNEKTTSDPALPLDEAISIPVRTTRQSTRLQSKLRSLSRKDLAVSGPIRPSTKSPKQSCFDQDFPSKSLREEAEVVVCQFPQETAIGTPDLHPSGIQKLQEEHRSKNKGKLVSLSKLRNASPALSLSSKKIRTRCKALNGAPRASCAGTKRLRSVSLERLSTEDLQASASNKVIKLSSDEIDSSNTDGRRPPESKTILTANDDQTVLSSVMKPISLDEVEEHESLGCGGSTQAQTEEISPMEVNSTDEEDSDNQTSDFVVSGESSQDDETKEKSGGSSPDDAANKHWDEASGQDLRCQLPSQDEDNETVSTTSSNLLKSQGFFGQKGRKGESKNALAPVPLSFLARNSPQKLETFQSRQEKLTTKVLLKTQKEEKRKDELKMRKDQELQEKIRKREERRKRVAENQAELRKQEAEKRRKLKDLSSRDEQLKKINQLKAKEKEEKTKKQRERMHAAEVRRRQEEEQHKKRLQQLEDDRNMVIELASKRRELEEEDKRQKRLEKMKLDRERQLQREAEILEMEQQKKRLLQDEGKQPADTTKKYLHAQPLLLKQIMDPRTKLEKLLESAASKQATATEVLTPCKQNHLQMFFQKWPKKYNGSTEPGYTTSSKPTVANTTFTIVETPDKKITVPVRTPDNYHTIPGSALSTKVKEKIQGIASYEMTPAENDPLYAYENYDIGNLSSEDSTDDEECPKKRNSTMGSS